MRIVDDALIASYRRHGRCEWCGRNVMLCAAHIFGKGAGQVDIPCNLVSLGMDAVRDCSCHHDSHLTGWPGRDELLAIAAAREGVLQDDIEAVVMMARRLPRSPREDQIQREIDGLSPTQRVLARKQLFRHLGKAAG